MAKENKFRNGYTLLARVIEESSIWRDTPDLLKLFLHLVLRARHNKKPKRFPGFEVKRGELVTSLAEIAEANEWYERSASRRWSRSKVSRMLARLQEQGRIKLLSDTYGTHIKVCNYDAYQNPQNYNRTEVKRLCNSSETEVRTNNNDNNGNNEKEKSPHLQVFNHWNLYKGRKITKPNREGNSVVCGWKGHVLADGGEISPTIQRAIAENLSMHTPEDICAAIDNYAKVLLEDGYFWSHVWGLSSFLAVKYESRKDADKKWWKFLPDNFVEENYLTEAAKTRRTAKAKGPSVYKMAKDSSHRKRVCQDGKERTA